MSFITYRVDKKSGRKYAYRQENVWDSERGQSRAKRTYLGRVDPETGEIIPKRGSSEVIADEAATGVTENVADEVAAGDAASVDNHAVSRLEVENAQLKARVAELEAALARINADALTAIAGSQE